MQYLKEIRGILLKDELRILEAMRALPGLTMNLGTALLGVRSLGSPTFLSWALTGKCQLECLHCANDTMAPALSPEQRLEVAPRIAESGALRVSLCGGEPLLAPEVAEIARTLKQAGKYVSITTNGELLPDCAEDLIDAGVDAIQISVDSMWPAKLKRLRGRQGLFNRVVEAADFLRRRRQGKVPEVRIRCTISRQNLREVPAFVDFWGPRSDAIHFQPVVDDGMNQVRDRALLFREEDETSFRAVIAELQRLHRRFRSPYYSLMPDYVFDRDGLRSRLDFICLLVSSAGMFVFPDGSASPCYVFQEESAGIGNLTTHSVGKIWRSPAFARARRRVRRESPACFCWDPNTIFNLYLLLPQALARWPARRLGFGASKPEPVEPLRKTPRSD